LLSACSVYRAMLQVVAPGLMRVALPVSLYSACCLLSSIMSPQAPCACPTVLVSRALPCCSSHRTPRAWSLFASLVFFRCTFLVPFRTLFGFRPTALSNVSAAASPLSLSVSITASRCMPSSRCTPTQCHRAPAVS
jgi:hypothetical protein